MKFRLWNVFATIVAVISLPLVYIAFYFSSGRQSAWISNLSLAVLLLFGLIGGIRGFMLHAIAKRPVPLLNQLKALLGHGPTPELVPRLTIRSRALLLLSFLISVLLMALFAWGIWRIISGGAEMRVTAGRPFDLDKPGFYTLWASSGTAHNVNAKDISAQYQIVPTVDHGVVSKRIPLGRAIYRRNGEKYIAVCEFRFYAPGSYRVLVPLNSSASEMVLQQDAPRGLIIATLMSFLGGCFSIGLTVYLLRAGIIRFFRGFC